MIFLSDVERSQLKAQHKKEPDGRIRDRIINRGGKKVTICASEAQPDQSEAVRVSGVNSKTIGPRARIDVAKPQQADCHLFTAPVNKAVLLYDKGWSIVAIAEALLLSEDAIREHITEFSAPITAF